MGGDPKHFHDLVRLYEGADHVMFRALDPHGNVPRIIKTPRTSRPSPWERASLAKEFEVTRKLSLSVPGVLRPLVLSEYDESLCLVFNDFPGRPLSSVLEGRPLPDLRLFFHMATELAGLLANVHAHHVVHRDLRPSNLLYSGVPGGDSMRLYNFAKASMLQAERPEVMEHRTEFGALAYISPELTGRMNRTVDHRSDLYSLGVIFYQLLSGRVPFTSDDPMELVHCHIAKAPPPIGPIRRSLWPANAPYSADIPAPLALLVAKLLAKGQEDRYQTAEGLVCDLQRCQSDYDRSGAISPFELGSFDSSGQLIIPQKLYGRDEEIATLTTTVQNISTSKTRLVLVHGAAGIGKSSLVNELHRHIFAQRSLLVSGKYEQFQSDVPYLGLRRAFADYSHQLLKLDPTALEAWRDLVWQKLGPNVALMTEVFPDLRPCLGEPEPLAALNNAEEQNRFHLTLVNFISEISREQPLVMFLDDLQWADGASIRILETLLDSKHLDHLLIIGAYRSDEVTAAHALQVSLNGLRQRGMDILEINLAPFDLETTNQFIAEIVGSEPERTMALAALVFRKTAGNQFFTAELIRDLARSGMLAFDPTKRCWTWNLAAIEQVQVAPNIAKLMVERLERLSPEALHLVKVSACVGAKFDLKTISMATDQSPEVIAEVMWEIMESGVVIPLNSNYRMIDKLSSHAAGPTHDVNISYQFQHDRVRAAAYSMLNDVDRTAAHYRIARLLLSRLSAADLQERIIGIVGHLNLGRDLMTDAQDRTHACRLNHLASTKATSSHAFAPALEYARIAHTMLPEHAWTSAYELAKEVTTQLSLCAYLANHVDEGERAASVLLLEVKTPLERAKVFQMQAINYNFLWDIDKSIRSSVAGLKELGIRISTRPSMFRILGELIAVKLALRGRSIQSIEQQTEISDPKVKLALRLLISFVPPAYMSGNSNLFAVAVLIKTKLAIKYGHSEETAAAFSGYAALLAGMGDFGGAHQFGEMAVRLIDRQSSLAWKSMTLNLYALFSLSWNQSWSELNPWFKKALDTGLESGDLLYTAFAGGFMNLWNPQLPLSDYIERQQKLLELIRETRVGPGILAAELQFLRALCIAGKTVEPASFSTPKVAEGPLLENDEAASHMRLADKNMMSLAGSPYIVEHCLFSFLTQASRIPALRRWAKVSAWLRIWYERRRMTKWSQRCPENFAHHAELMTAEIYRLRGKDRKASHHFGRAIEHLKQNKALPYKGLIWERAGAFYTTWGDPNVASHYLRQAEYFYQTWAATICVDQLRAKYGHFLGDST
ncbi:MAG: AAA family ATPase, partial [Proteobacteria bacterium]|nr:AAA family ATPase [Pseudomonadota bacterium]